MNLDTFFQYAGPNKNPLFAFVGAISGLFCYEGDRRLEAHDRFLGTLMILVAIVLVCASVWFYIYLALNAPNSTQAREFERSSARELKEHDEQVMERMLPDNDK